MTYAYNGDGLRDSRTQGGNTTRFTWSWGRPLPRLLYDGTLSYVYGLGSGPLMSVSGSSVQGYFLTDGLGSVANVTDASGNAVASYTYDAYGAIRSQSGSSANYWGFTGEQRDAESGFTYLRERYYDVETGRFLSQDPWTGNLMRPISLNKYIYASNNPTNLTDPTGLHDACAADPEFCMVMPPMSSASGFCTLCMLAAATVGLAAGEAINILVFSDNDSGAPEDANAVEGPEAPTPEQRQVHTNQGIKYISSDTLEKLAGRGINIEDIEDAINNGERKLYRDQETGSLREGWYDSGTRLFVGATPASETGESGSITTAFVPDRGRDYFDSLAPP